MNGELATPQPQELLLTDATSFSRHSGASFVHPVLKNLMSRAPRVFTTSTAMGTHKQENGVGSSPLFLWERLWAPII